ncbi:MAG: translation initiation factor IF-6 [Candidatus Aenigmarchaeota archaeon]|nr:translation initiation factor IF-6 [Candidatus Aenigmarchaeota archaeon]
MKRILKTYFEGDVNLGLFGFATDSYCLLGVKPKKRFSVVKVPVYARTVMSTGLVGMFLSGNSSGIIAPCIVEGGELKELKKIKRTLVLDSEYTALGNLVLMNDNGIVLSPMIRKYRKKIEEFFGIPCAVSKIANTGVVGSAGIATNKGCLVHPDIRENERDVVEKTLKVPVDIGTVAFGSGFVGSGIVANSFGIMVPETSSGPELGRVVETLGFI